MKRLFSVLFALTAAVVILITAVDFDTSRSDEYDDTPAMAKKAIIEQNRQMSSKDFDSSAEIKPSKKKSFFVGNAPFEYADEVEFTTLININNRLRNDFVPSDLVYVYELVDTQLVTLNYRYTQADQTALTAFCDMMQAAHEDGVDGFFLRNVYRSYEMQEGLWNKRIKADSKYGRREGEPLGSAYPGSSEHQTGLAFDITCVSSPEASTNFKNTENYRWLRKNSYKFGFVLRYQAGKEKLTGIKFEPYHYRYVGKELAKELYTKNICLEEYFNSPVKWEK